MEDNALNSVRGGGTSPKTRESNLELYRIIVMLLIVAHHYVVNSGLTSVGGPVYADPLSWRSLFLLLFGAWGKTGINCFVLITGYFMCKSRITAKKFAKLLGAVYFYRVVINGIFWLTGYSVFSLKSLVKLLIPVTSIGTGFTGAYLVFFLFIPFLNVLVQNMTRKQHVLLLVLCSFTYIFLGTVPFFSVTMNYVSWFMVLYLIASFIRLYPCKLFENRKLWGWMTLASVAVSSVSVIACTWLGTKLGSNMAYTFVTDSNTFLAVATGVCSFLYFKNMQLKYSKIINTIAASTFGVLLIHANSDAMRQWLWKDVLNNVGVYDKLWMLLHAIGSVLLIFAVCTGIDYLRIRFVEKPFFQWWDKHWENISDNCNEKLQKLKQRYLQK